MGFFKLVWVWGGVGGFWIGFYVLYVSVGGLIGFYCMCQWGI